MVTKKKVPAAFEEAIRLSSTNNRHLVNGLFALATHRVRVINLFNGSHPALLLSYGTNTRRKPTLLLRLPGVSLLR